MRCVCATLRTIGGGGGGGDIIDFNSSSSSSQNCVDPNTSPFTACDLGAPINSPRTCCPGFYCSIIFCLVSHLLVNRISEGSSEGRQEVRKEGRTE